MPPGFAFGLPRKPPGGPAIPAPSEKSLALHLKAIIVPIPVAVIFKDFFQRTIPFGARPSSTTAVFKDKTTAA
jgi:hypothetical protein